MDINQFINQIAALVAKYAPKYNILVHSPIIAQAILESAGGTSELAINAQNYFGLKYNPKQAKRCPTANGTYVKTGSEQNPDGTYVSSVMQWQKFPNMDAGVQGYFDFLDYSSRYDNLKGVTDPYVYLQRIKADGYATSLKYVDNVYSVIQKYNLTKYDSVKPQPTPTPTPRPSSGFTNSPLVCYTRISPNRNSPRDHKIDKITIHHMAGNLSIESCGNVFASTSRQASSNYGIGSDGRIGMYVEEKDRSWCSSNRANDMRAITIEVANDAGAPSWHVSDKALASVINLCVDICQRNGIARLNFTGDKNGNLTMHKMFAATACPGPYLESKFPYIAAEVNRRLAGTIPPVPPTPTPDPKPTPGEIQVGDIITLKPGAVYTTGKAIPSWVYNKTLYARSVASNGDVTFSYLQTGAVTGTVHPDQIASVQSQTPNSFLVKVTATALNIRSGPSTRYPVTGVIKDHGIYTIVAVDGGWGKLKSGAGWISLKYTKRV